MPARLRRLSFAAALAAACFSAPSLAQQPARQPAYQPGLQLRSLPPGPGAKDLPTFLSARRIEGIGEKEVTAEGDAELHRGDASIAADWMRFENETGEVDARGHVRLEKQGNVMTGPSLRYRTSTSSGEAESPDFTFAPRARTDMEPVTARAHAERVVIEDEQHMQLFETTFTTCAPGDDDWYLKLEKLDLDFGRDLGVASWSTVYFKNVPLLKTPYLDFSLNERRKSGLLPPIIGTTGKNGPEVALPYYLNLAPNYDLTLVPRYMTKRGLQIGGEARFLEPWTSGVLRAELLPHDNVLGTQRSAVSLTQVYATGPISGMLNLNRVSDDDYFRDLSTRVSISSQTYLPRDAMGTYSGRWWDGGVWAATTRFQNFQTLQDPLNPRPLQYARLPQLLLNASKPGLRGADFAFTGEVVDFSHPTQVIGLRTIAYPSLSFPMVNAASYVTPKIGLHSTSYSLTRALPGTDNDLQRNLPIFSTDAGLTLERDASFFGSNFLQTLEPRAYYVNVPFKDQSQYPLFDTSVADFNYAQIFSENSFVGGDRISDANQMTVAMTSRLLSPGSGQEVIRAAIAQRYYFRPQRVMLAPSVTGRPYSESDWLASLAGRIAPRWTLDTILQYDPRTSRATRFNVSARYQPEVHKILNLGYRYFNGENVGPCATPSTATTAAAVIAGTNIPLPSNNCLNQIDVSGEWPVTGGWYGVGRYNYSLRDGRVVESLAGFEYNGGCWVGRFILQRFATGTGVATNAVFMQLELSGFSRIGSNPLEALRRNIPGYTRINQVAAPERAFDFEQ